MLWGPTAFEVPHRPSRTGQSAGMRACPRGICRSNPLREYSREHTLNVTELQSVCHWIVMLGIIRAVQKLFRWGGPNHSLRHADKNGNPSRIISSVHLKIDRHLNPTLKSR